ncbi:MAG: helix-turn-helix domain-containing protein, partial [Thermodesulfovibrionia bacterium]|nr:helix-turn-helix domain-containing protein [Thermodesulfovibrionia bacterium]
MKNEILTLEELQKYLKIGRNTAFDLLKNKKIKAKKVGRQWRILKREV